MSVVADWARDLFEAAEELGYAVQALRPDEVVLVPVRGGGMKDEELVLRSFLMSGARLREILRPLPERKP